MTLEDECKHLIFIKEKLKEYRKAESETISNIITYLKNHNHEGVTFKHGKKKYTLMVEATKVRKTTTKKEREKKVQNILINAGVQNVDMATKEIINGLNQVTLTDQSKNKLKLKVTK
jgi:hypothetical protein